MNFAAAPAGASCGCHAARFRPDYASEFMSGRFVAKPHDFDFLVGRWNVANRRLRERHFGLEDWEEFPATSTAWSLHDGRVSVDEIHFPSQGFSGMSLRTLEPATRRWSIRWVNSRKGVLEPPVRGGFDGGHGEFYGEDFDLGRPVLVRFIWSGTATRTPRWEQAFSIDGGKTWETNWIMSFTRADA